VQIIRYPHPTLRYPSKPLRRVDAELRKMIRQMFDLLYEHEGIGLAANQVDLPYRLVVVNLHSDPAAKDEEHVFINPVITHRKGSAEDREGCLSLPEIYGRVARSERIVLNAYNPAGEELTYELDGLAARVVQHEVDGQGGNQAGPGGTGAGVLWRPPPRRHSRGRPDHLAAERVGGGEDVVAKGARRPR